MTTSAIGHAGPVAPTADASKRTPSIRRALNAIDNAGWHIAYMDGDSGFGPYSARAYYIPDDGLPTERHPGDWTMDVGECVSLEELIFAIWREVKARR